ncbi:MAG: citrate lyase subunit alpha [Gemmobacter sp.]
MSQHPWHHPHPAPPPVSTPPVSTPLGLLCWHGQPAPVLRLLPDRPAAAQGDKRLPGLAAVFDRFGIGDGAVLSFHHHYRNGDRLLNAVLAEARRRGLQGLTLCPSSLFPVHAPLAAALGDGTVAQVVTDYMKGPAADAIAEGALSGVALLQSHGGRARAISGGQLRIDVAFIAAPLARADGSATGRGGPLACGPLGYPAVDSRFARASVVAAHDITADPLPHTDIPAHQVDAVIAFARPGDIAGIQSGSTVPADTPEARDIGTMVARAIRAAGLMRDGLSLQSGAGGLSLAAVPLVGAAMAAAGVRGSFLSGGIAGAHVDLLAAGLFDRILDVQCFDLAAVRSSVTDPAHRMMNAIDYASPLNPGAVVNELTVMLLGAVEVDRAFNVNVVSGADGRVLGGPGGHPDAAQGARLSIVTTALTGGGFAKVVPQVRTIATPGAHVDLVVTPQGGAVNPARPDLAADLGRAGLLLVGIDDLCRMAADLAGPPSPAVRRPDAPRILVEHREGTLLDGL